MGERLRVAIEEALKVMEEAANCCAEAADRKVVGRRKFEELYCELESKRRELLLALAPPHAP